jgi:hypothetical protein
MSFNRRHTDITRAKMSAASKRALADPAVRAKMSAASKRAWADPAVRAKMSAASKRALADPAVRAKMSAARKRAWADPAVRAKMSAARKRAWADPAVRARMDWLGPDQIAALLEQLQRGDRAVDVANDWLISTAHVYFIARKYGVSLKTIRAAAKPLPEIRRSGARAAA